MAPRGSEIKITERQRAILSFVAEGYSNQQIAEQLGISENGVKGHVARLLSKFDVPNRAGLVRAAARTTNGSDSGREVLLVMKDSLQEVLGETTTVTLLKRAGKRAGVESWNPADPPAGMSTETVGRIVAAIWPLLIELTGRVLVGRLEQRGFDESGEIAVGEVAKWMA